MKARTIVVDEVIQRFRNLESRFLNTNNGDPFVSHVKYDMLRVTPYSTFLYYENCLNSLILLSNLYADQQLRTREPIRVEKMCSHQLIDSLVCPQLPHASITTLTAHSNPEQ